MENDSASGTFLISVLALARWVMTHILLAAWIFGLLLMIQLIPIDLYAPIDGANRVDSVERCTTSRPSSPTICDTSTTVSLPDIEFVGTSGDLSRAHYWFTFELEEYDALQALMFPRVSDHIWVEINGVPLTPGNEQQSLLWHDWNKPIKIPLPDPVLNDGLNRVDITLSRVGEGNLGLYPFYVGDADRLRFAWFTRFGFRTGAVRMTFALAVLQGLAFLALWRISPRGAGFGWLPLMMGAILIFGWQWSFPNLAPSIASWSTLWCLSVLALVYFTYRFADSFFGQEPSYRHKIVLVLMGGSAIVLLAGRPLLGIDPLPAFFAGVGAIGLLILGSVLPRWEESIQWPQLPMFVIFSLSLTFAVSGWIDTFGKSHLISMPLSAFSLSFLFVGINWILLQRMVELKRQSDHLNASLQDQVNQKSADLARTYAALGRQTEKRMIAQERQRIMLDLHDGIGGQLVNTLAYLENAGHRDPVLHNAIEDALRDMGLMIDSLHLEEDIPMMLGMIRSRLEPLLKRHQARFEWKVAADTRFTRQTPSNVLALMRIVQEAITNAVKHSGASVITVESEERAVRIADNGRGFDPARETSPSDLSSGIGLSGMRQRADSIGIACEIKTSSEGTLVHLYW